MNREAWFRRLDAQLPGWKVWYAGTGGRPGTSGWYAAPVPPDTPLDEARTNPYKAGPFKTPQDLRDAARRQDETPER